LPEVLTGSYGQEESFVKGTSKREGRALEAEKEAG